MPHIFSFAGSGNCDASQELSADEPPLKGSRRPSLLRKNPLRAFKRNPPETGTVDEEEIVAPQTAPPQLIDIPDYFLSRRPSLPGDVTSEKVFSSLPRPRTFRRQRSEQRATDSVIERTAVSVGRPRSRGRSASSPEYSLLPTAVTLPSTSAPNVVLAGQDVQLRLGSHATCERRSESQIRAQLPPLYIPAGIDDTPVADDEDREQLLDSDSMQEEYERRWILNLSMQFRDKSNREKLFVTYAERPNKWRRLTISLDYRNAPEESLEADLSTIIYQRDKSLRIYEAIRESLPDIQYYDTVTNLKLETTPEDGQLHVHVREDTNETIEYPVISLFDHVQQPRFNESSTMLESHLSGFVYKVRLGNRVLIKKEIPGPDVVDEFQYEVNALDALIGCDHVVQLEGLVVDDRGEVVKGLLLSYASRGTMADMIFDLRGTSLLPWHRREKWAKQIVSGLADIHEAGFVQGDFTLSNIVIDEDDNALIIDINRRGCPVGWEPPELVKFIKSGQRIRMCIGVKTDLYQLGMVLWALAEEVDEPELVERPLPPASDEIPEYYRNIVETCLRDRPQGRASAKELLRRFPISVGFPPLGRATAVELSTGQQILDHGTSSDPHRSGREYIDPNMAVTIDDVKCCRRQDGGDTALLELSQVMYLDPDSVPDSAILPFASSGSWIVERRTSRGRSPASSGKRRRRCSPYDRSLTSATSLSEESPGRQFVEDGDVVAKQVLTDTRDEDVPPTFQTVSVSADASIPAAVNFPHTDSGFAETSVGRSDLPANDDCPLDADVSDSNPVSGSRRFSAGHTPVTISPSCAANEDVRAPDQSLGKTERGLEHEETKVMNDE